MKQALESLAHTPVINRDIFGFSTYGYHEWAPSSMMACAKAARVFEWHVDLGGSSAERRRLTPKGDATPQWRRGTRKAGFGLTAASPGQRCRERR